MNFIKKALGVLAIAGAMVLGTPAISSAGVVASSESGALFNAVGETSDTLSVAPFAQLSIFVSGTYAVDNVVWLQRGHGGAAWENVIRVTGASTTANLRVVTYWENGPNSAQFRLIMSATGTGDVVAYLTDKNRTVGAFPSSTSSQIVFFDDFDGTDSASTTALNPSRYLSHNSDSGGGTAGVYDVAIQEGAVVMNSGTTAENGTCMSSITNASQGGLVSDGPIIFEISIRSATLTGQTFAGMYNVECVSDTVPLVDVDSGVVSQIDAGSADLIGIVRQDEATDTTSWQAISALADAEGANALEVPFSVDAVANTYSVLRVETDTEGNGYFYVGGELYHAEALAVATTARLSPVITLIETAPDSGAVISFFDYWVFVQTRPVG